MDDVLARFLTSDEIRNIVIIANMVAAFLIGPYMAFAVTPDAGFRCPIAFLRLLHRISLVALSIALFYNAVYIMQTDRVPTGPALLIDVTLFLTIGLSAIRHGYALPIPESNTWGVFFSVFTNHKVNKPTKFPEA